MIFLFEMAKCFPALPSIPALLYVSNYQLINNIKKRESRGNNGNDGKSESEFPQAGKRKCLIFRQRERWDSGERKFISYKRSSIENFYKNSEYSLKTKLI